MATETSYEPAAVAAFKLAFLRNVPWGHGLVDQLGNDGFTVNHCRLLIVCDDGAGLGDRLPRLPNPAHLRRLAWPMRATGPEMDLRTKLESQLPTFDLFEQRDPVRGRQVFGRGDEITQILAHLEKGHALGVFGLRKMGKTTLIRAVTDRLDPVSARLSTRPGFEPGPLPEQPRALVVWVDVQGVPKQTTESLAGRIYRELQRRLTAVDLPVPGNSGDAFTDLDRLLECAASSSDLPVCLVLDEYDLLFERLGTGGPFPQLDRLFGPLRGRQQQTNRLTLVAIGREPDPLHAPTLDGRTNPLFQWFTPHWTGPFTRGESDELVVALGRRTGLDVGPETLRALYQWTGGHPRLVRLFGTSVLRASEGPAPRPTDTFLPAAEAFFTESDELREMGREIRHLLGARHPAAEEVLQELAVEERDRAGMLELMGGWAGEGARMLRRFGLLAGSADAPRIPRYLEWYMRTQVKGPRRAAHG